MSLQPRVRWMTLTGAVLVLGACMSVPAPTAELAASRAALEQAQNAGAAEQAPAEFALARDKATRAQSAAQRGEFVDAKRLAEQAELDAQLAQARGRAASTQRAAGEIDASLRTLRNEMQRKP